LESWGRLPNGTGAFQRLKPTAGAYNRKQDDALFNGVARLWPNPAQDRINLFVDVTGTIEVKVMRSDGRLVLPVRSFADQHHVVYDTGMLVAGHYMLHIRSEAGVFVQPFTIIP
jgi:hypothetical protein